MGERSFINWQVRIFILCWIAYAFIYFGRVNLSVAIPDIQAGLGVSKAQVGIIGSVFFWVYGTGQLVNGYIGDKVSSRIFIFIGLCGAAAANILFGFASGLTVMLLLWAVNGCFQSMLWGPITKTLTCWISPERRSRAAIGISTSMVGGFLLAWGLSSRILTFAGWKWVFWIPGMSILTYSFIWFAGVRNRPSDAGLELPDRFRSPEIAEGRPEHKDSRQDASALTLWQVINKTKLWFVVAACLAQGIVKDGISLWAPTFLMETHKLGMEAAGSLVTAIPLMNFGGMMLAGWLTRKLGNREKTATAALFGAGIAMIAGLFVFGSRSTALGLAFLGLSSSMMYGANTLLLGVVPMSFSRYNKVSSIAGFLDFCSYLAAGFAASITGLIVDRTGWSGVLSFWLIIMAIATIALVIAQTEERKVRMMENIEIS